jgi:hypothetical protein
MQENTMFLETDPVSQKHCFFSYLELRAMDKVQKPSNSECHTPSSESFRFYFKSLAEFVVLTAVVMNFAIFWDTVPCNPHVNRCLSYIGSHMYYIVLYPKRWQHSNLLPLIVLCLILQLLAAPLYQRKLALTSPTNGGRSVGIVRSQTKATEIVS